MAQGTSTTEAIDGRVAKTTRAGSRYVGVTPSGFSEKPWRSQISIRGKTVTLGRFATEVEAARAFDAKAREIGRARSLNFPDSVPMSDGSRPTRKAERGEPEKLRRKGQEDPAKGPQVSTLSREVEIIRRVGVELEGLDRASAQRVLIYIASFYQ